MEEDIKKYIRVCMHKVGQNETNDDYSYEDNSNSEQNDHEITSQVPRNPYSNLNDNAYNSNNGGYNNFNNWNASANIAGKGMQRDYNFQLQNQYPGNGNNFDSTRTNTNNNQTEQDRACLVHCFFHELKMVNIKYSIIMNIRKRFLPLFFFLLLITLIFILF